VKVAVDADLCQGHARCWDICPEVFELDDEGYAYVATGDIAPELEARVRQAASNCPERAISID
jgi:ferredoxin